MNDECGFCEKAAVWRATFDDPVRPGEQLLALACEKHKWVLDGIQPEYNPRLFVIKETNMRYYEVYLPDEKMPYISYGISRLKGLPDGTRILATITERDGSLAEQYEIPVANGKPQVRGRNMRIPKAAHGRF